MVGISGSKGERVLLVMAKARRRPPLMAGMAEYICSNIMVTWPPIRSVAPADPLL